jgi:hypothetical protein
MWTDRQADGQNDGQAGLVGGQMDGRMVFNLLSHQDALRRREALQRADGQTAGRFTVCCRARKLCAAAKRCSGTSHSRGPRPRKPGGSCRLPVCPRRKPRRSWRLSSGRLEAMWRRCWSRKMRCRRSWARRGLLDESVSPALSSSCGGSRRRPLLDGSVCPALSGSCGGSRRPPLLDGSVCPALSQGRYREPALPPLGRTDRPSGLLDAIVFDAP